MPVVAVVAVAVSLLTALSVGGAVAVDGDCVWKGAGVVVLSKTNTVPFRAQ